MGWYQDNFPGSPAQRQRNLISRGIIIYTLVTGAAIYFFAPVCRRLRKEFAEGRVLPESAWLMDRLEQRKLSNRNFFSSQPTLEQLLEVQQDKEKKAREDYAGPDCSEETLRSTYNRRE